MTAMPMPTVTRLMLLMVAAGAALSGGVTPAHAADASPRAAHLMQPRAGVAAPAGEPKAPWDVELAAAVRQQLDAPYLTPDEAKDLRIRHGTFAPADLDTPARRARAAIIRGNYLDASLADPAADPLDAAEAALHTGELDRVLELTTNATTARGLRLRAGALELAGKADQARSTAAQAVALVRSGSLTEARSIAEAVRASVLYYRMGGTPAPEADLGRLMAALAQARRLDASEPAVPLAEAEILLDRDNFAQSQEALREAMSLRRDSAEAIALLGQLVTAAFDISAAEAVATKLGDLTRLDAKAEEEADKEPPPFVPVPSLAGAVVRARAMLRQNDPELAAVAISPAMLKMPKAPLLLAVQAAISGVRYEFDTAEAQLTAFEKQHPGSPLALTIAGKALAEARQYERAASWLKRAVTMAPNFNQPAIELGLLYVQSGQDEDAQLVLEKAFKLDPFNVRVDNSLRLIKKLRGFDRTEGKHFLVRSRPGIDTLLAREMIPLLDAMHDIVTGGGVGLMHAPPHKTFIDLMPGHQEFAVRIAGIPRIHTIAASTGPVIAMETPREAKGSTGTYDWLRVVRHEYTHTVGLSKTSNRIPHWFTEAQAVYLEQGPRDMRTAELLTRALTTDSLFDFVEINLAFTRPRKPTDRAQAYAQGHWMYQFIVRSGGEDAPRQLMQQYAKGVREADAFKAVLGKTREEFFTEFLVWARTEAAGWGMLPPKDAPTIQELLDGAGEDVPRDERGRVTNVPKATVEKWLTEHPGHPDVLQMAVLRAIGENNGAASDSMRDLLVRYATARPVDGMPHQHLAELELAAGNPAKAAEHLEFLDVREESSPKYALRLARIYAELGDWKKASAKAERAATIAPYLAEHRELAATCALQNGELATAERHIRFLIALEPDRPVHTQRLDAIERMKAGK